MHTRPIEADSTPEPRTDLDTTVAEQLLGALKAEPGYAGALTSPTPCRRPRADHRSLASGIDTNAPDPQGRAVAPSC